MCALKTEIADIITQEPTLKISVIFYLLLATLQDKPAALGFPLGSLASILKPVCYQAKRGILLLSTLFSWRVRGRPRGRKLVPRPQKEDENVGHSEIYQKLNALTYKRSECFLSQCFLSSSTWA